MSSAESDGRNKQTSPRGAAFWTIFAAISLIAVGLPSCRGPQTTVEDIDVAVERIQFGEIRAAIQSLERIVEEHPGDSVGDRAALCLGNALIQQQRHKDALEPLRRASQGQIGADYARLLTVRAIVEGELFSNYEEGMQTAGQLSNSDSVSSVIREEANFLVFKLLILKKQWLLAALRGQKFLHRYPASHRRHEVQWWTAESFDRAERNAEAHTAYSQIWYENPESPWAEDSREKMVALGAKLGFKQSLQSPEDLHEFIHDLREAGLHEFALQSTESFLRRYPKHPLYDRILLYKAMSQYALRRNRECVNTVDEMRRVRPNSELVPLAANYAIRALGRHNDIPSVRRWVNWVVSHYPEDVESSKALFNWGVFLASVGDDENSLRVLRDFVRQTDDHKELKEELSNALWKMVWIFRNRNRTNEALIVLEELLRRFKRSQDRAAALYWTARFISETYPEQANELFLTCLREFPGSYYGYQSKDKLLSMGATPPEVRRDITFPKVDRLNDPAARPNLGAGYVRAVHLNNVGLFEFALLELLTEPGVREDPSLQFVLASLFARSGNPREAVRILREEYGDFILTGSRDPALVPEEFWRILYPFNHRTIIVQVLREAGLEGSGIDSFLVAALIHSESLFLSTAVSPVGAVGLMQLMPATAQEIARRRKIPEPSRSQLLDPETNIRYGIYYLAQRLEEFDGRWFLAICSYDAGPNAVMKWWNRKPPHLEQDEFIENIPSAVTRAYIKEIIGTYRNYLWLYSEDDR